MSVVNVYNATSFEMAIALNGTSVGTIQPPPADGSLQPLAVPFDGSQVQPAGAFGTHSQLVATSGQTSWLYGVEIDNSNPWGPFALVVFEQGAFLGGNGCDQPLSASTPPGSQADLERDRSESPLHEAGPLPVDDVEST